MQQYTFAVVILGTLALFLTTSVSSAAVLNCPPNNLQESNSNLRSLCYAIEQVLSENSIPQEQYMPGGRLDDRNVVNNNKRQDVDHVFLRFGRRFGL